MFCICFVYDASVVTNSDDAYEDYDEIMPLMFLHNISVDFATDVFANHNIFVAATSDDDYDDHHLDDEDDDEDGILLVMRIDYNASAAAAADDDDDYAGVADLIAHVVTCWC